MVLKPPPTSHRARDREVGLTLTSSSSWLWFTHECLDRNSSFWDRMAKRWALGETENCFNEVFTEPCCAEQRRGVSESHKYLPALVFTLQSA